MNTTGPTTSPVCVPGGLVSNQADAKIGQPHVVAVVLKQDVLRLHVAVDYLLVVRGLQAFGNLPGHDENLVQIALIAADDFD